MTVIIESRLHNPENHQTIERYVGIFASNFGMGNGLEIPLQGFVGRVVRGVKDRDFEALTDNPKRKIVFLLDSLGLCDLVGLQGRQILNHIGYDDNYIDSLLARQTKFKLVVLPEISVQLATWDNLLNLVAQVYPEWFQKIEIARPFLKTFSYERIKSEKGVVDELRTFLEEIINVNRLFGGDGFTRRELDSSQRVYAEYVSLNRFLIEFGAYGLIGFPVA